MENKDYKIKFLLAQAGRTLVFEIYEMDERFRNCRQAYLARNGIEIISSTNPALSPETIFLRGSEKSADDKVVAKVFESAEDAEESKSAFLDALEEWSKNWEGFKESDAPSSEPNIYTF